MKNAVNWFEIPVKNYERAKNFYAKVLGTNIIDNHMPEKSMKYGIFSHQENGNGVGGAIIEAADFEPSTQGSTVYLNGGDDLGLPLMRVEHNGGKIVMPKTNIGDHGFIAQFLDTEGNRVALHSMQ